LYHVCQLFPKEKYKPIWSYLLTIEKRSGHIC